MSSVGLGCALISVSDKAGILALAQTLVAHQIPILATGGTARYLEQHQIPILEVADYTGFPEMMEGRVKTLHPKIYGGILRRPGVDDDVMQAHAIYAIDIVVVNLYPFAAIVAQEPQNHDKFATPVIENIDIGGPCLIRAAAKNFHHVAVITDPNDYIVIINELNNQRTISQATRQMLAQKAFAYTAQYDTIIAEYFMQNPDAGQVPQFPAILNPILRCKMLLRYGENPHQAAAFYVAADNKPGTISSAVQLQGKPLSYNNLADADVALECVKQFTLPGCVIVKHANPCGIACQDDLYNAYLHAYACDPTAAFGGIIAFNRELEALTVEQILKNQFVEVIIAPSIAPEAMIILATKPNIRVLASGLWQDEQLGFEARSVAGGVLLQERDLGKVAVKQLRIVTQQVPTDQELNDLIFAWQAVKFVKSNAIVYVKQGATLGIGAGQMSRIDSTKIAVSKAHEHHLSLAGAVMASDAFFPFPDCVEYAARYGIKAIIQPGGSIRDQAVIDIANQLNLVMIFTGMRHFKH